MLLMASATQGKCANRLQTRIRTPGFNFKIKKARGDNDDILWHGDYIDTTPYPTCWMQGILLVRQLSEKKFVYLMRNIEALSSDVTDYRWSRPVWYCGVRATVAVLCSDTSTKLTLAWSPSLTENSTMLPLCLRVSASKLLHRLTYPYKTWYERSATRGHLIVMTFNFKQSV